MARELYIHVGPHKTGTSYVQEVLYELRVDLAARGLHVLDAGRRIAGRTYAGHHGLVRATRRNENVDGLRTEIARELEVRPRAKVFVSSENLEYLTAPQIRDFLTLFPDADPQALMLFREWGPLLYSNWQEDVKHGGQDTYETFHCRHAMAPEHSEILDVRGLFGRWVSALGKGRASLASYEAVCARDNICATVLQWAGVDASGLTFSARRRNLSFDPFTIEIIRALNELATRRDVSPSVRIREVFLERARGEARETVQALTELMRPHLQPTRDDLKGPFRDYCAALRRDLPDALLVGLEESPSANDAAPMVVSPAYGGAPGASRLLDDLWRRILPALRQS